MENWVVTDVEKGLSCEEARRRLGVFGPNEFEKKREFNVWQLLVSQFSSPLIYILLFAGAAKIFLRDWLDAGIIMLVVLVNTMLGFWQEFKAAKSLEALKSYLKPKVTVLRGGGRQEILMSELVPGDICFLDSGGGVAADGVVISREELRVNEALLTGESRPVEKFAEEGVAGKTLDALVVPRPHEKESDRYVYMGTSVSSGIGMMMVLQTGSKTEMGKIASTLVATQEGETPLQQKLAGLARILMMIVVVATVMIFGVGVLKQHGVLEMFETAIAMAVAAIPEGLAVSMTVILALGMQRILKQKALVRKLVAAETLGSVSVICCDKTGTLTEGKMRVVDCVGDRDELIQAAILANDERDEEGLAMVEWAGEQLAQRKVGWTHFKGVGEIRERYKRIGSIPFSSERKFVASLNQNSGKNLVSMVGAPDVVLKHCSLPPKKVKEEQVKLTEMASKGFRLLGVASKEVTGKELTQRMLAKLTWHGFLVFEDPVRKHVKESLVAARKAGVKVKVITGDYKETARAVLSRLFEPDIEMTDKMIITGDELAAMSKKELSQKIDEVVLFARTTPDQKLKIVEVLKEKGEVVAMTGDGVNDAPALKSADIGVVVNEATDVSKETADMVLLDSNFRTIVEAIREGRVIFQTMRKVVVYLISNAFQEIILIGGSLFLGLPLPLSAIQILWINLVEDGLPGVALAFDTTDEGVMEEKPRKREGSLLDLEGKTLVVVIGVVANLIMLSVFYWFIQAGYEIGYAQTLMFLGMGTNTLLFIFSAKALRKNIWQETIFDNRFLLMSVVVGLMLMALAMVWPPLMSIVGVSEVKLVHVSVIVLVNILSLVLIEMVKFGFIRHFLKVATKSS